MPEKILIVDDDLDTLKLIGMLLDRKGYSIVAANNGKQALEKAAVDQPDLILLDVMMPDINGYEVVLRLRANNDTAGIPIIMFTAKNQVDDKVAGLEAGADDYLTKPTHPAELLARVKAILSRSDRSRDAAPEVAAPSEKGKIIGVLAAKGGVGVSTVALNLAAIIKRTNGKSVSLAEFRAGDGTLGILLGTKPQTPISTLLKKEARRISLQDVENALVKHDSGLNVLLASNKPENAHLNCEGDKFLRIANHLNLLARTTVIDLGSSLNPAAEKLVDICNQLIIVVEPSIPSVLQTKALLDDLSLRMMGLGSLNIVVVPRSRSEFQLSRKEIQGQLGRTVSVIFSHVPELAFQATQQGAPMVNLQANSITTQQFRKLAEQSVKV